MDYLKAYRPLNILFILAAQFFAAFFLDQHVELIELAQGDLPWFMLATAATLALGYWMNDWLDKERDIKNSKQRFAQHASKTVVVIHILLFLGFIICAMFAYHTYELRLLSAVALFLVLGYNLALKNVALLGNFIVAFLCMLSLYGLRYMLDSNIDILLLLHFTLFCGILTVGRELAKDAEDEEGDRATGAKTLAVLRGNSEVNSSIYIMTLFALAFLMISLYFQYSYFELQLFMVYLGYYIIFIAAPLFYIAYKTRTASEKSDYVEISTLFKYILFVGVLSILFY